MTNLEIKEKIDNNNKLIEALSEPDRFVLNKAIKDLLEENEKLQKQCTHNFVDGICEYCYVQEPKEND